MKPLRLCLGIVLALGLSGAASRGADAPARPAPNTDIIQAIAAEAARQDLVVEPRINELIGALANLQKDLRSNGTSAAGIEKRIAQFAGRLQTLHDVDLGQARASLRAALASPAQATSKLQVARRQIDAIRRELGSLLLHAGMSQAAEVFADELDDLATQEESIEHAALAGHADATTEPALAQTLDEQQHTVAGNFDHLLGEVGSLPQVATDALAAVRVSRTRKYLQGSGVRPSFTRVENALAKRDFARAAENSTGALDILRSGEGRLRPEAGLMQVIRTRNQLNELLAAEVTLRREVESTSPVALAASVVGGRLQRRQSRLAQPLLTIGPSLNLAPFIPAALTASGEAEAALGAGKRDVALTALGAVESNVAKAIEKLEAQIADAQRLDRAYHQLQEALARFRALQDLRDRQAQIVDDTDAAAAAQKDIAHLGDAQQAAAAQLAHVRDALPADPKDNWAAAMRVPLGAAATAMAGAEAQLRQNSPATAAKIEREALQHVSEAASVAHRQAEYLDQLWSLTQLAGDLRELGRTIGEVQAEQHDLRTETARLADAGQSVLDLTADQETLAHAGAEIQEVASLISEAHAADVPLIEARRSLDQAAIFLGQDKGKSALPVQQVAEDNLGKTQKIVADLAAQTEFLARWAESMQLAAGKASDLLQRQILLRQRTEQTPVDQVAPLATEQTELKEEAEIFGEHEVCGEAFKKAAAEMAAAAADLRVAHKDSGVEHQKKAEELLREAIKGLYDWLLQLKELKKQEDIPGELSHKISITTLLMLMIMKEEDLIEQTRIATPRELPDLAASQLDIRKETQDLGVRAVAAKMVADDAYFTEATGDMDKAVAALRKPDSGEAVKQEQAAEHALRKSLTLVMVTSFQPSHSDETEETPKDPPTNTDADQDKEPPPPPPNPKGNWKDFVKSASSGAAVAKNRSQWESLSRRDRGALNENFARELPLEYREMLKDYYHTLSK